MKLNGVDLFLITLPDEIEVNTSNQSFYFKDKMYLVHENMADGFTLTCIDDNERCHNTKKDSKYLIKKDSMYSFKELMEFLNLKFIEIPR